MNINEVMCIYIYTHVHRALRDPISALWVALCTQGVVGSFRGLKVGGGLFNMTWGLGCRVLGFRVIGGFQKLGLLLGEAR